MLLAIDIGNSSIKFGIFDGPALFQKFAIQTNRDYTSDELMFDRLKLHEKQFIQVDISMCIVASVVPELDSVIAEVCRELFKVSPQFVDETWDLGLNILYEPPSSAGIDRLVNSFAAVAKYGKPCIVCSFGTATTIDVVNEDGDYLGGIIAPGMLVSARALNLLTAKLPVVPIARPDNLIGNTTVESILSGIVLGHFAMVRGLLSQLKGNEKVVATGGFAQMISSEVDLIDIVDENLSLDGLRMLAERAYA